MIKFKSKKSLLFLGGFILLTSIITSIGILLNSSLNEKVNAESSEGHITYILNGGEGNEEGTYEIGTKHTLERPTKEGYYFGGWYEDSEFQGNGYYCVPKEAVGNKTYYAKWVSNEKTTISNAFYAVIGNYDTEKRTTSYRNYSITKLMFSSFIPEGYVERTISPGYTSNFSDAKVYHNPDDLSEVAIVYEGPIAINISDANRLFQDWSSLEEIEIGNLDLSYVSSAKQMFYSCSSLARVYIHSFDNLSITNGTEMFRNASCSTLDLGNMNTSSMTDMSYMFSGCKAERLDLRSFNTANVSDFNNMFAGMRNAKFIDVSSFNLGSAIDVSNMFYNLPECTGSFGINGTSIRLGEGFDTSNVTSARYFVDSVGCNEIDFSTLDFSNFTASHYMNTPSSCVIEFSTKNHIFYMPLGLGRNSIFIGSYLFCYTEDYQVHSVSVSIDYRSTLEHKSKVVFFGNITADFVGVDFESESVYKDKYVYDSDMILRIYPLYGNTLPESIEIEFNGDAFNDYEYNSETGYIFIAKEKVPFKNNMKITAKSPEQKYYVKYHFNDENNTTVIDTRSPFIPYSLREAPTKEGATFAGWYNGKNLINEIPIGSTNCYDLYAYWEYGEKDVIFPDNSWKYDARVNELKPKIISFTSTIPEGYDVVELEEKYAAKFPSEVKFYYSAEKEHYVVCNPYGKIIAGERLSDFFFGASYVKEIDFSNFYVTEKTTNMSRMFISCYNLEKVSFPHFNTSKVTNMSELFDECYSLKSVDISMFDLSSCTHMSEMFLKCSSLTGTVGIGDEGTAVKLGEGFFARKYYLASSNMFDGCTNITGVDLTYTINGYTYGPITSFKNCKNLKYVKLANDKENGNSYIASSFNGCSSLEEIDLSCFNLGALLDHKYIAETLVGCNKLKKIICPLNVREGLSFTLPGNYIDDDGVLYTEINHTNSSTFKEKKVLYLAYSLNLNMVGVEVKNEINYVGENLIKCDGDLVLQFAIKKECEEYYELPNQTGVKIKIDGKSISTDVYIYDENTGMVSIPKEFLAKSVDISIEAAGKRYEIRYHLEDGTVISGGYGYNAEKSSRLRTINDTLPEGLMMKGWVFSLDKYEEGLENSFTSLPKGYHGDIDLYRVSRKAITRVYLEYMKYVFLDYLYLDEKEDDLDFSEVLIENSFEYGESFALPEIINDVKGYYASKWILYVDDDYYLIDEPYEVGYVITNNYARDTEIYFAPFYKRVKYKISYDLQSGTYEGTYPTSYTIKSNITINFEPQLNGAVFLGWTIEGEDKAPAKKITIGNRSTGDIKLIANYEYLEYKLTYHTNSNIVIEDVIFTSDDIIQLVIPNRIGYRFNGWFTDSEFNDAIFRIELGTDHDVDVYASWDFRKVIDFEEESGYQYVYLNKEVSTFVDSDGETFEEITYERNTYESLGYIHGLDDKQSSRVVIGNVPVNVKIKDIIDHLNVFKENIRIISTIGLILYEKGNVPQVLLDLYEVSEDEFISSNDFYSLGTGTRIEYIVNNVIVDTIYISILGDVNGNGSLDGKDYMNLKTMIRKKDFTSYNEEIILASYIVNNGSITSKDYIILKDRITSGTGINDYFNQGIKGISSQSETENVEKSRSAGNDFLVNNYRKNMLIDMDYFKQEETC